MDFLFITIELKQSIKISYIVNLRKLGKDDMKD